MTFGSNPADIIIVLESARRLYQQCKNASNAYFEISREIRALHTVLRHLKYEVQAPESILNRDRALYARDLAPLIADCRYTLEDLEELIRKYGRLRSNESSSSKQLRNLIKSSSVEMDRFGSVEMGQLGRVRVKLINHKTNITALLDTIQLSESSRLAATLDNHGGQLDIILDKVDNIAARMGQRASLVTYDDDDKEDWKIFRRELVAEGFSSDVLTRHKVSTDILIFNIWFQKLTLIEGCFASVCSRNRSERPAQRCTRSGESNAANIMGARASCSVTSVFSQSTLFQHGEHQL
jgi:hypothetical protein